MASFPNKADFIEVATSKKATGPLISMGAQLIEAISFLPARDADVTELRRFLRIALGVMLAFTIAVSSNTTNIAAKSGSSS